MKLLKSSNKFIEPEEVILGYREDTVRKGNNYVRIQKKDSFQYVSIIKTLTLLFNENNIRTNFEKCMEEIKKEDALYFSSEFWQRKTTLRLLLYYDEIEIKYPLGDASTIYKLGMFYFTILNLRVKTIQS